MDFCQTSEVLRSAIGLAKAPFRATDGVVVKAAARRAHDSGACGMNVVEIIIAQF